MGAEKEGWQWRVGMRDGWRDRRSERGVRVTQGRKRPSEKKLTGGWVWRSETHGCFQGGQSGACLYHQHRPVVFPSGSTSAASLLTGLFWLALLKTEETKKKKIQPAVYVPLCSCLPSVRMHSLGQRSVSYSASSVWNSLHHL